MFFFNTWVIIQIKNYQEVLVREVLSLLSFWFTTVNLKDDFLNPNYSNILNLIFSLPLKKIKGFKVRKQPKFSFCNTYFMYTQVVILVNTFLLEIKQAFTVK